MKSRAGEQHARQSGATPRARFEHDAFLSRMGQDIERLAHQRSNGGARYVADLCEIRERLACLTERAYDHLSGWQTVHLARHPRRPRFADYVGRMVKDFCELHGDRCFADDRAVVTGFCRIAGHRLLLIGHNRGRTPAEKASCRFGYAHPEGYRKALHKMKLAEKFGLPVVTWIDTPGAYPGVAAEQRGIAQAIATNLKEMSRLRVPIICVILGEGGSGGALGIGVGDRLAMLKHAYYSVITPEGCAAILFRNSKHAQRAADALHLRAADLVELGLIDDVVNEPVGGAHRDPRLAAEYLETYLAQSLRMLKALPVDALLERRRAALRRQGECLGLSESLP